MTAGGEAMGALGALSSGDAPLALARVVAEGRAVWAVRRGDAYTALGMSLGELLRMPAAAARSAVEASAAVLVPERVLAPIDPAHEVWAAGVSYARSRDGRIEEASDGTPYDRVYAAERPELFFKAVGSRVVGVGDTIGVRADSAWNAPEPELGVVLDSRGGVFGYVTANDVSSRTIEGDNLLYLPQAKVYTGSCALGPEIVPAWVAEPPFALSLEVRRAEVVAFAGTASTTQLARGIPELADWLFRALDFPDGVILLTGTGIVPGADFTLQAGDEVIIAIPPLGELRNPVVSVGRAG